MRTLIIGAGATGGYFGARLAQAGHDVTLLVRPARAEALRRRGLRLTGLGEPDGRVDVPLLTAAELADPYDLILLTVKATGLARAVEDFAPAVGPDTVILPVLNGLAHLDLLTDRFGAHRVWGGVAKIVTTLNDDGDIVRLAPIATLDLGPLDGTDPARAERTAALLDAVPGVGAAASADIRDDMWAKWSFIATVSTVNILGRGSVGEVVSATGGAALGPAAFAEAAAVAAASGNELSDEVRDFAVATATRAGSPLVTSLYRDMTAGLPSEAEHLFGDLVARARALGVPTPLLDLATLQLRVQEAKLKKS
ncbi:2-dehydropantoate 2-reductase [Streptomyces spiroverticillatus]|uniref:2-dehydropantoate 2-reductase n=1 Tax=Streptomyces finlayi TaxID=67296 RepID=A0A919CE73_9ACTN|nr:ketopantoate reductase family protein [Streptomyces finlayi]GHA39445.1 2-dehydropantoate 2-reductase [Streptomyces spiroverticillatus]GHD14326.1 2-dehydropantoate 2-reductase [Streptomyces finlayi]